MKQSTFAHVEMLLALDCAEQRLGVGGADDLVLLDLPGAVHKDGVVGPEGVPGVWERTHSTRNSSYNPLRCPPRRPLCHVTTPRERQKHLKQATASRRSPAVTIRRLLPYTRLPDFSHITARLLIAPAAHPSAARTR